MGKSRKSINANNQFSIIKDYFVKRPVNVTDYIIYFCCSKMNRIWLSFRHAVLDFLFIVARFVEEQLKAAQNRKIQVHPLLVLVAEL